LGALAFVAASWSEGLLAAELPHPYELIQQAGNAHDELDRLRLLRQVAARTDLDPALRADLDKVLPVVEQWANGKAHPVADTNRAAENGYLCHFINSRVRPAAEGPVHPPEPAADSPLHPLWSFYRGRMLIWRVIQSGPLLRVKERREAYFNEGRRLLEEARRAFPENRVIRMYLDQPIPWPESLHGSADVSKRPLTQPISPAGGEGGRRPGEGDAQQHSKLSSSGRSDFADPQAPDWANLQREGLEKLADIIHWWIAERQLPDGQFGGGWGDDVEMCRWWTPVLIGFEDPVVNAAQERLSSGIFRQPHLKAGFTSRLTDVEHSNEDTTDTILPMMHLRPDDPLWKQRALRLAELMRQRWTGTNQHGFLQFRSIYFSVDRVDASPDRAFDTVYHPAVVQPALLYWQRTADPALTALFGQWLRLWVDATARGGNGKPAGVLPSAVRWPDGAIGLPGRPWWEPFSPGHNDALYNWPGACRLMTSTLLLAWYITGDESYLQPIRSMAEIRLRHLRNTDPAPPRLRSLGRAPSGRVLGRHPGQIPVPDRRPPIRHAPAPGRLRLCPVPAHRPGETPGGTVATQCRGVSLELGSLHQRDALDRPGDGLHPQLPGLPAAAAAASACAGNSLQHRDRRPWQPAGVPAQRGALAHPAAPTGRARDRIEPLGLCGRAVPFRPAAAQARGRIVPVAGGRLRADGHRCGSARRT